MSQINPKYQTDLIKAYVEIIVKIELSQFKARATDFLWWIHSYSAMGPIWTSILRRNTTQLLQLSIQKATSVKYDLQSRVFEQKVSASIKCALCEIWIANSSRIQYNTIKLLLQLEKTIQTEKWWEEEPLIKAFGLIHPKNDCTCVTLGTGSVSVAESRTNNPRQILTAKMDRPRKTCLNTINPHSVVKDSIFASTAFRWEPEWQFQVFVFASGGPHPPGPGTCPTTQTWNISIIRRWPLLIQL